MSQVQEDIEDVVGESQLTNGESQDLSQDAITLETPISGVFVPPSVSTNKDQILNGSSYTHFSPLPEIISLAPDTECVLGIDEAGRGPVLGPMVYSVFYLPISSEKSLLSDTHSFMDSKVLTPAVRSNLMQTLCTAGTDLHTTCGWAVRVMSARDISAGMLKAHSMYNLNAQAMDATIGLINETFARGVNVREIYIDTIGNPASYQKRLERIFPATRITVAKKADSLYPCVSAASVCAKVTRDAALEVCYEAYEQMQGNGNVEGQSQEGWGSGYPSDTRCTTWLKSNMNPLFGWGPECRFSWGTVKELLEPPRNAPVRVDWPEEGDGDDDTMKVTSFFASAGESSESIKHDLINWFGTPVTAEVM